MPRTAGLLAVACAALAFARGGAAGFAPPEGEPPRPPTAVRGSAQPLAGGAGAGLPDLAVAWISFTPRYPAWPASAVADERNARRWPRSGERITATARVMNFGGSRSSGFAYAWKQDGKKLLDGRSPGLEASVGAPGDTAEVRLAEASALECPPPSGCWVDLSCPVHWKKGRVISLEVRSADPAVRDANPANNARAERVDSSSVTAVIIRDTYVRWTEAGLRPEDWLQSQFGLLARKMEISTHAGAPGGVEQGIRFDGLHIVPDREALEVWTTSRAAAGWDGLWPLASEAPPADRTLLSAELERLAPTVLGIVPLPGLRVEASRNSARHPGTGEGWPLGFALPLAEIPFPPGDLPLPEHSVLAANRIAGTRGGVGGRYLWELPKSCRIRVLDIDGRAVEQAEVTLWQSQSGTVPKDPLGGGTTDADGVYVLPNRAVGAGSGARGELPGADAQALPGGFRPVPIPGDIALDGANGLLLARIAARQRSEWAWLAVTSFNVEAWKGQSGEAVIDVRTHLPGPAPPAPTKVAVSRQRDGFLVRWGAPDAGIGGPEQAGEGRVAAYFVYRAAAPDFAWRRAGAVTGTRDRYLDQFPEAGAAGTRYAVTVVTLEGVRAA